MKKINLKGISEILSEKELKNVKGGSGLACTGSCSGECFAVGNVRGYCRISISGCICSSI
ncbi:TIGR04149 family rSAM-modified RiPP [Dysgonomonas sp. ZJ709]|uniref:TIGR04149 family rSAM-modified RiPP n=1 Tax=Dysgonomonas sp. ZJ709 TaxID=2709797 RepID=UPI0013ED28C3